MGVELKTTETHRKAMRDFDVEDDDQYCMFCGDSYSVDHGKESCGYCHPCASDNIKDAFSDIDTLVAEVEKWREMYRSKAMQFEQAEMKLRACIERSAELELNLDTDSEESDED